MVKTFCDICESEITAFNSVAMEGLSGEFRGKSKESCDAMYFNVQIGKGSVDAVIGDFCKHCVIDAVKSMDDRDQVARCC